MMQLLFLVILPLLFVLSLILVLLPIVSIRKQHAHAIDGVFRCIVDHLEVNLTLRRRNDAEHLFNDLGELGAVFGVATLLWHTVRYLHLKVWPQ